MLCLLAAALAPQSVVTLVAEGDSLPGGGVVTSIERAQVSKTTGTPDGMWIAVVVSDGVVQGEVLLRDGLVLASAGDAAPQLAATQARITGFGSIGLDHWGDVFWIGDLHDAQLDLQARFNGMDNGVETGQPVDVQAFGATFGAGSTWTSYLDLHVEGEPLIAGGLVLGAIDDPTWPGGARTLLASGPLVSFSHCCFFDQWALTGDPSPLAGRAIEGLRTQRWSHAKPASSTTPIVWSCDLDGAATDDGCVFRSDYSGDVLVAREGAPSPVAGRVWGPLEDVAVDASTHAHWTLRAQLDASDTATDGVILLDGALFAREGDVIPASAPAPITDLGQGRAFVTDQGHVIWYAAWDGPDGPVEAILRDDQVLLRTGSSVLGGAAIAELDGGRDGFDATRLGTHVVARVRLDDGRQALVKVAADGVQNYCTGKASSGGCVPDLRWSGGPPSASAGSGFSLDGWGLVPQVPALVLYGLGGPADVPFAGGTLCIAPPFQRLPAVVGGGLSNCAGKLNVDFNAWVASGVDPALVAGVTVHAQIWMRDPGFTPPEDVALSQALVFSLAP